MRRTPFFAVCLITILVVALASCRHSVKDKIIRKWQEVRVENPQMDEEIYKQQLFMDTVGTSTDSLQNSLRYGTANIDTMKAQLRANLDSFRKGQARSVAATWFDFRGNGTIYTHSDDGLDSAAWHLEESSNDEERAVIIDVPKMKGKGRKLRFTITEASDTLLRLRYTENYLTSTAVFRPAKK